MDITLANQYHLYPNENIREVLRPVGTKWNVNTYFPGFGTGGITLFELIRFESSKNKAV